jgi:hypothetical protein
MKDVNTNLPQRTMGSIVDRGQPSQRLRCLKGVGRGACEENQGLPARVEGPVSPCRTRNKTSTAELGDLRLRFPNLGLIGARPRNSPSLGALGLSVVQKG